MIPIAIFTLNRPQKFAKFHNSVRSHFWQAHLLDNVKLFEANMKSRILSRIENFMADSLRFPTLFQPLPKAEQFSPKFHKLVLGCVGSINEKGIDFAQPIWSSGCPM